MKNKWILLGFLSLLVVGCNNQSTSKNDKNSSKQNNSSYKEELEDCNLYYETPYGTEEKTLYDVLNDDFTYIGRNYYPLDDGIYENKWDLNTSIETYEDLIDLFNYCAFYRVPSVDLKVDKYLLENEDELKSILYNAWWDASISVGTTGFKYIYNKNLKILTIDFITNSYANSYHSRTDLKYCEPVTIPYTYYPEVAGAGVRTAENATFPYQEKSKNSKIVDVYNSDQLIFALERNMKVNILKNSPAEYIYNVAKNILNSIINENMNDEEKIISITSWILSHNVYDWVGCADAVFVRKDGIYRDFPDYVASMETSFYAEGSLIYGTAVCQGMAKGLDLLALMEGIEIFKVSAPANGIDRNNTLSSVIPNTGYESHGYCYAKIDGKYYICDTNYSFNNYARFSKEDTACHFALNRNMGVLISHEDWVNYYGFIQADYFYYRHADELSHESKNIASYFKMKANGKTFNCSPSTEVEYENLRDNLISYLDNYNDESRLNKNAPFTVFWLPIYFDFIKLTDIDQINVLNRYYREFCNVIYSTNPYYVLDYYGDYPAFETEFEQLDYYRKSVNVFADFFISIVK